MCVFNMSKEKKQIDEISIPLRYCGPPDTANGGYLAGKLAAYFDMDSSLSISFRAATPLGTVLSVVKAENNQGQDQVIQIMDGEKILAIANTKPLDLPKPTLPNIEKISKVKMQCAGFEGHPFPECFVCGPDRPLGDGLGIYPGPVSNDDSNNTFSNIVAAEWELPKELKNSENQIKSEFIWAALDCVSAFANLEKPENQYLVPMVLGHLSAKIENPLEGEKAYVIAWPVKVEGRKAIANSAVFNQQQECIAIGQAVWISLNKI